MTIQVKKNQHLEYSNPLLLIWQSSIPKEFWMKLIIKVLNLLSWYYTVWHVALSPDLANSMTQRLSKTNTYS